MKVESPLYSIERQVIVIKSWLLWDFRQEWPSETERCLEKIRQIKAEEIYGIAGKEESSEM